MQYKQLIEDLLQECLRESWMTTEDYSDIVEQAAFQLGEKGYDQLVKRLCGELEVGVKNGIEVETQISLIRLFLKM